MCNPSSTRTPASAEVNNFLVHKYSDSFQWLVFTVGSDRNHRQQNGGKSSHTNFTLLAEVNVKELIDEREGERSADEMVMLATSGNCT